MLYAGEFTTVNGVGQQGLARFAVPTIAPNDDGPRVSGGNWPIKAVSSSSGTVAITWPANYDRDNSELSYRVIRDGNTGRADRDDPRLVEPVGSPGHGLRRPGAAARLEP